MAKRNLGNGWTAEVDPSARANTLDWYSLGPEYVAAVYLNGVIQGTGFESTEDAAILAAKRDAKETFDLVCP